MSTSEVAPVAPIGPGTATKAPPYVSGLESPPSTAADPERAPLWGPAGAADEAPEPVDVLLVDDRHDKLLALEAALRPLGQRVVTASSGEEALRVLLHQDFAVILLDVNMLGLDGFETAAIIRKRDRTKHTPIIFVSAISTTDTHVARGYELGAVDYVFAPVAPEILRAKVAAFVDLFQARLLLARQAAHLAELNEQLARQVQELRLAEEAAGHASKAKSDFLSRMSHELRTPLNSILGFAQLLALDEGIEGERAEEVSMILKGGRHLVTLIDEVLDIARIESGRLTVSLEPVAVPEVIDEVLEMMRPLADRRALHVSTEMTAAKDRFVLADRQRLKQVLLNLLSNAVKYNHEGGSVTCTAEAVDSRLRVSVADTGPGIPPDMQDRLFAPFERLGAELTDVEGSGVGLALSRYLTEAMGGDLGVTSEPGSGSTFWVELDLTEAGTERPPRAFEPGEIPPPERRTGDLTILYVEDNLTNLQLVDRLIARRPATSMLSALQGSLGLELARSAQPDLILLDVNLPDISGSEVLRALKSDEATAGIPVVMLSADATPSQISLLLEAGARAYLTKPIDVREFYRTLDDLVGVPPEPPG